MSKRQPKPGEKVREWRESNGVTLANLALEIGYEGRSAHSTLQQWEVGKRTSLPLARLMRLAEVVGIPVEQLATPKQITMLAFLREHAKEA